IDKFIQFSKPNYCDRLKMFDALKIKHPELDIEPVTLAKKTNGFTHSDISIVPREIKLKSNISNDIADNKIIDDVFNDIKFGKFTQQVIMTTEQISRIAYHEIGHTIISYALITVNKPNKITIEPCGKLLGHTSLDSE